MDNNEFQKALMKVLALCQFVALLGIFVSFLVPGKAHSDTAYTFGIVPQQSASKMARLWVPILTRISSDTGYQINFATAPTIPEFERRLAKGEYDFAYMNPYHYTVFHDEPGYEAFARQKDIKIKGIIVTAVNNPINSLQELDKKVLAFPAPNAFAATILTRAHLDQHGIVYVPRYVSSHDSVYRSVAAGLYPAGGGIRRTFNNIDDDLRKQLNILWETEPYTPHAFTAHPRINTDHVDKIKHALLDLNYKAEGKELLATLDINELESAHNSDWDDIRSLDIKMPGKK